ncbi:LNS2-domain-containing protein [Phanerochaete sordida]|uniref:phosphatidate phosphatase n=1 Tax=Phanerochaete sordida TaxID=48140 RepID=A0A9P3L6Z1_9APHY|nr:LNS2-domain-containing protein [Phanerochaete sordida]
MNYLRGAVNAISAPYQYYKDINPSTLTGAIDVIVISRPKLVPSAANPGEEVPAPDGEREFACSPFHVRFGKWQVLRPADKKVNVYVNGNPVPFSMKIGDAGEAFFVFETDEDIPENIATSPILEATKPGQTNAAIQRGGRFGAKEDSEQVTSTDQDIPDGSQEPDFLDLNASDEPKDTSPQQQPTAAHTTAPPNAEQAGEASVAEQSKPGLLERTAAAGKAAIGMAREVGEAGVDKLGDHQVKEAIKEVEHEKRSYVKDSLAAAKNLYSSASTPSNGFPGEKGDEVLPEVPEKETAPDVAYGHDMVFDMEGYHSSKSHNKEKSDRTITSRGRRSSSVDSASSRGDLTPGPSRSPSPDLELPPTAGIPFPRATSEPPPDIEDDELPPHHSMPALTSRYGTSVRARGKRPTAESDALKLTLPERDPALVDEYSWEWGNFPQKTPVWTAFAEQDLKGKRKGFFPEIPEKDEGIQGQDAEYGSGGVLTVDRRDPTRFRVFIEGRSIEFQLSLVPDAARARSRGHGGTLGGRDVVEDTQLFEKGKIDFEAFLRNDDIVKSDNLVLCLEDDKYITRADSSPLMDALLLWRRAALEKGPPQASSRAVSPAPFSDEESALSGDESRPSRPSLTRPIMGDEGKPVAPKPSSSSWIRWWSRRTVDSAPSPPALPRPELRQGSSAPLELERKRVQTLQSDSQASSRPVSPTLVASPEPVPDKELLGKPQDDEQPRKRFAKTLRLTSEQLKSLDLKPGANSITFSLSSTGVAACTARIFVWDHTDFVVVSDIDGTITKSDALGHVFTMIGRDWTHLGVAKLYTDIARNGYKIMYLTSRAIGQADSTRDYLRNIKQNDYQLPEGPVIMSPDRLMASLHREVIMRKPEVFKMACLRDIQRLFGPLSKNPFYAGFGNRITDALSYRSVNVPSSRIFTIDSSGEVKMELLELAGYKSSYIHMTDLVDQMFPPINRQWAPEYTDFNYWKTPIPDIPLPDLAPPSPALSARSDTSNVSTLARLRHFSLTTRTTSMTSRASTSPPPEPAGARRDAHLRQMSSFERLSSTLSGLRVAGTALASPRTLTPTEMDSDSEDEGDLEQGTGAHPRRRERRRSVSSMPGSLPGSSSSDEERFGEDEDEEEHDDYGYEGGNEEEEVAEEAFDEDLLAAGEMQNVPFL